MIPRTIRASWNKLRYMSIMPSILITIEKSIAENGVVLKHKTTKLMNESMSQNAETIVIENDSFGKNSATDIVESMIR